MNLSLIMGRQVIIALIFLGFVIGGFLIEDFITTPANTLTVTGGVVIDFSRIDNGEGLNGTINPSQSK